MRPLNLNKKIKPAKRVWKTLTNSFKPKLENLEISSSLRTITARVIGHNREYKQTYEYQIQHQVGPHNNFAAVYVDKLCGERQRAKKFNGQEGTSRSMGIAASEKKSFPRKEKYEDDDDDGESVDTIEDAWRAVVAASPHLRPVDDRADEFIYKFREERRIEKEKSLLEFQEMLKRSA